MNNGSVINRVADIVLNVKVHCLEFFNEPGFDSKMDMEGIKGLFMSVNDLWRCAGIRWRPQSCIKKRVCMPPDFDSISSISEKREWRVLLGEISPVTPLVVRSRIWNVCLMGEFPVASWGVYLPETQTVFLAELSHRKRPNAVPLAHELGHMLGLHHVRYEGNLMNQRSLKKLQDALYSSPGGIIEPLNEVQIEGARTQAFLGPYEQ